MEKKICIIGASGFAKEVYWLMKDAGLAEMVECFMEPDELWQEREVYGVPVRRQSTFDCSRFDAVVGIGDSRIREKVVRSQLPPETGYPSVIHPTVLMSPWVQLGRGAIICARNIITCDIVIGDFPVINLDCTIGHDTVIGEYFTLNPGVNVSGQCNIGKNVTVGTGAGIRQGITICDNVTIGMGAAVVKDIVEPGVYAGTPAKKLS